jgi:hypothetical protein
MKTFLFLLLLSRIAIAEPIKTPQHVFSSIEQKMLNHPGDYPFPTDMTFCKHADHSIIQITEYFDPSLVKKGDTIFVADWYLAWFTEFVHPKIKHPYILISNDSDSSHPDTGVWNFDRRWGWAPPVSAIRTLLYDPKVAAWFCKNMLLSRHPKIHQIPIGQNIIYLNRFPEKEQLFQLSQAKSPNKECLLYAAMQTPSHKTRVGLAALLKTLPFCEHSIDSYVPRSQYFLKFDRAKFTVAPPGYGPDTVRFWEAITLNCIPIVVHSELDDLYADLPVLFVHDWTVIADENFLKQKWIEIESKNLSREKVFFNYWLYKINAVQTAIRYDQNSFSSPLATEFPSTVLENLTTLLKREGVLELFCKGAVMTCRPFQIAEKATFLKKIYVQDDWGAWAHEKPKAHFEKFLNKIYVNENKVVPSNFFDNMTVFLKSHPGISIFFDLSYLRHRLKDDLENYIQNTNVTFFCGNCGNDLYVREYLEIFEQKYGKKISFQGDIWYFKR